MDMKLLITFAVFLGLALGSHDDENDHAESCWDIDGDDDSINVFLSVISAKNPPLCKLKVSAPVGSTLYQVMVLGEKQHPGMFSFQYKNFTGLGRYVTCINSECQMDPFYWIVYNGTSGLALDKGIDETYPGNDDSFIWKLKEFNTNDFGDNHTDQYMGPCATVAPVTATKEDIHPFIHVKLSAVNDRDPSWPSVCNLPVLAESGSSLGQVMDNAQNQHPKKFRYTTDVDLTHGTYVMSINDLANAKPWYWLVYDAKTEKLLPTGLDDTRPTNNDAYLWRFINKTHPFLDQGNGGTSAGPPLFLIITMTLSALAALLIKK